MLTYLVAFLTATIVAAALTPLVVRLAYVIRAVDHPGEARKIHTRPIPRIGGIGVVAAFFAPLIGLAIYTNRISGMVYQDSVLFFTLLGGALAIVCLGVYDDIRGADARLKLIVQTLVAVGMWYGGFRIELLGTPTGGHVALGLTSLPLTVIWLVGVTNALNLIDGLDGLAAGTALFAVSVLFGVAMVDHSVLLCVLTAALAGSILGFLFFNFNPARIFLGDSGSMFLGFILAAISIWTQRKGATAAALIIPVIALGLPILDTTLSVVRRVGQGKNPFQADKEHLHHRLLALGLSHRGAVLTLYTASGIFALSALTLLDNDTTHRAIALSTVAVIVFILVRKVGVFSAPRSKQAIELRPTALREEVRRASRDIRKAATPEEAWATIIDLAPRLGLEELRLAWSDGEAVDREVVQHWRAVDVDAKLQDSRSEAGWKLESQLGPYDHAKNLLLDEGELRLGELRILFRRGVHTDALSTQRELGIELLRDALIDFRLATRPVAESESASRVLHLAPLVAPKLRR